MSKDIELDSEGEKFQAYISEPQGDIKGGLIVIHEVWGLVDHTKDVADRFAQEGYLVIAPDLLSEAGITPESTRGMQEALFDPDPEKRNQIQPKLRELTAPMHAPGFAEKTVAKVEQCFDYLLDQEGVNGRVGITGFCFGGSYSFSLAVHEPRLKAAVPFYGHADFSVEQLRDIKCPVLAFYGEKDENLMTSLPELKDKMKEAGVNFTAQVYENCGHAFFNDTNKFAYNPEAASDAWDKTLKFLASNLA